MEQPHPTVFCELERRQRKATPLPTPTVQYVIPDFCGGLYLAPHRNRSETQTVTLQLDGGIALLGLLFFCHFLSRFWLKVHVLNYYPPGCGSTIEGAFRCSRRLASPRGPGHQNLPTLHLATGNVSARFLCDRQHRIP